jgi:hypothetical protein
LSACIEYYRGRVGSVFADLRAEYLFPSTKDAKSPEVAARAGFTHLLGPSAKQDERIQDRLRARVRQDYPEQAERCERYVKSLPDDRKSSPRV